SGLAEHTYPYRTRIAAGGQLRRRDCFQPDQKLSAAFSDDLYPVHRPLLSLCQPELCHRYGTPASVSRLVFGWDFAAESCYNTAVFEHIRSYFLWLKPRRSRTRKESTTRPRSASLKDSIQCGSVPACTSARP